MSRLPPLAAIRAFEAAARHGNYTRAGEELGLTQAGVSYQIKSLEQRVGAVLFARNGRSMELTPAGEALAPRITEAFDTMERAFASLGESDHAVLSIACFQAFATKILAPRLGTFQLANPEIAVRLDIADHFVDLEKGDCDLAIRLSRDVPATLDDHVLTPLGIAPFASPAFLERHEELSGPDPRILDPQRISPRNIWWDRWDEARADARPPEEYRPPRGLEFNSQLLDAAAARSGNGVAILTPMLFSDEVAEGKLVRVGERTVEPGGAYRLLHPEARRHSPKVKAFRDWFFAEMQPLVE